MQTSGTVGHRQLNLAQPWRHQAPLKTNENGCVYPCLFICVAFHKKLFCVFKTMQFQWFSNHDRHPFVIAIIVHTYSSIVILSAIFYSMAGLTFQYQHSIWEAIVLYKIYLPSTPPLTNIPHFAYAWQHSASTVTTVTEIISVSMLALGGFSGSVLAFGTQVRGFALGQSRRIFRAKKSSTHLPSEGK